MATDKLAASHPVVQAFIDSLTRTPCRSTGDGSAGTGGTIDTSVRHVDGGANGLDGTVNAIDGPARAIDARVTTIDARGNIVAVNANEFSPPVNLIDGTVKHNAKPVPKERGHSCPLIGRMRFLRGQECPRSCSRQANLDCSGRAQRRRSFGNFSAHVLLKSVHISQNTWFFYALHLPCIPCSPWLILRLAKRCEKDVALNINAIRVVPVHSNENEIHTQDWYLFLFRCIRSLRGGSGGGG